MELAKSQGDAPDEEYFASRVADMELEAAQQEKDAFATYGMLEGLDPSVSLHRALAVWRLKADDIAVLSIHGTSTAANEKNETHLWHDVFNTIGRTPGNAVPVMAQRSLVGHSKGGSAAWQAIGLLQSVITGIVPGNRNADNIDVRFQHHTNLMFPSKTIHTDGIRAGVMVRILLYHRSFILTVGAVVVRFRPGWWHGDGCPPALPLRRCSACGLRRVQGSQRSALPEVVQGHVGNDDHELARAHQGWHTVLG